MDLIEQLRYVNNPVGVRAADRIEILEAELRWTRDELLKLAIGRSTTVWVAERLECIIAGPPPERGM